MFERKVEMICLNVMELVVWIWVNVKNMNIVCSVMWVKNHVGVVFVIICWLVRKIIVMKNVI